MKKIILTTILFLGLVFTAQAQTKVGVHFGYGSEIDRPLIGANAEFGITDKISIAPDFTYYFTEKISYVKTSMWELNANAHYYFMDKDKLKVFGLGGLNYTHAKVTWDGPVWGFGGESSESDSEIGFNLGGGATYDLTDKIQAFSTLKYTIGSTDQVAIFIGARYVF